MEKRCSLEKLFSILEILAFPFRDNTKISFFKVSTLQAISASFKSKPISQCFRFSDAEFQISMSYLILNSISKETLIQSQNNTTFKGVKKEMETIFVTPI